MITRTAKEVIAMAKYYGQVRNSNLLDFEVATNILNQEYTKLYNEITDHSDAFVKYFQFGGPEAELPKDCYLIKGVYNSNGGLLTPVTKSPLNEFVPGTYRIENNKIVVEKDTGSFTIKYVPTPDTITAPDEPELLHIQSEATIVGVDDHFIYYSVGSQDYIYSIDEGTTEEADVPYTPEMIFMGKYITLIDGRVMWGDEPETAEDITNVFERVGKNIIRIAPSGLYMAVSYDDGLMYIFNGFAKFDLLNFKAYQGRKTIGTIEALCTNDFTGRGAVYFDGTHYYLISFVPDTVLSYPSNVYFDVIVYRMAAILASMNGIYNEYLVEKMLPQAETLLYKTLTTSTEPPRIKNINKNAGIIGGR